MPNEYLEATRNFGQMKRGDKVWGDPADEYWANEIKAGNIIVTEATANDVVNDYFDGSLKLEQSVVPDEDLIPAEVPEDFEDGD